MCSFVRKAVTFFPFLFFCCRISIKGGADSVTFGPLHVLQYGRSRFLFKAFIFEICCVFAVFFYVRAVRIKINLESCLPVANLALLTSHYLRTLLNLA